MLGIEAKTAMWIGLTVVVPESVLGLGRNLGSLLSRVGTLEEAMTDGLTICFPRIPRCSHASRQMRSIRLNWPDIASVLPAKFEIV